MITAFDLALHECQHRVQSDLSLQRPMTLDLVTTGLHSPYGELIDCAYRHLSASVTKLVTHVCTHVEY